MVFVFASVFALFASFVPWTVANQAARPKEHRRKCMASLDQETNPTTDNLQVSIGRTDRPQYILGTDS
jgi:hypothetical protein